MSTLLKVREAISQQLDVELDKLTPETTFESLYADGYLDSLGIVEIVLALEETFEIDIPDEDTEGPETIADLVAYVDKRLAERTRR